jgi:hypothetical protein
MAPNASRISAMPSSGSPATARAHPWSTCACDRKNAHPHHVREAVAHRQRAVGQVPLPNPDQERVHTLQMIQPLFDVAGIGVDRQRYDGRVERA